MMNNTSSMCCTFSTPILDLALPPVLIMEFILGLLGNCIALLMFAFHIDTWKPTSVYLFHLTVADTVVMFCLPFRADYYLREKNWIYGDVACRILMFLLAANRAAGIFFLTAVAVDRYIKVVHPHHRLNRLGACHARLVSCFLWAAIVGLTFYLLLQSHIDLHKGRKQCESFNICFTTENIWHSALYLLQFFLPSAVIAFCTARIAYQLTTRTRDRGGRIRRAVSFVLTVSLVFLVCFLPSTVAQMVVLILKARHSRCSHFRLVNLAFYATVCLTYLNSVLNPVLYYLSSPELSRALARLWHRLLGRVVEEESQAPAPPASSSGPFTLTRAGRDPGGTPQAPGNNNSIRVLHGKTTSRDGQACS